MAAKEQYEKLEDIFGALSKEKAKAGFRMGQKFAFEVSKTKFLEFKIYLQGARGVNDFLQKAETEGEKFFLVDDIGMLSGWKGLEYSVGENKHRYMIYRA